MESRLTARGTARGRVPRLLAISERKDLRRPLGEWLAELGSAGVDAVQLREKDLDDRACFELATEARSRWPGLLLVNGRSDVALAAGCDGVHLGSRGLPVAALRRRFGAEMVIGRSTHHPDEVAAALEEGADYAVFGPVFPTPSKASYGPPVGVEALCRASAHGLPVLALGGVDASRLEELASAGAAGAAGIRVFQNPASLAELVAAGRRAWPEPRRRLRGQRRGDHEADRPRDAGCRTGRRPRG